MEQNVATNEYGPRVGMAIAVSAAALCAPPTPLKVLLLVIAGGVLATVATGYCPITAFRQRGIEEAPAWHTLRTWRVDTPQ